VAEHGSVTDLQQLAFRSGVDYHLLDLFDQGDVTLSEHHVAVLTGALGEGARSLLTTDVGPRTVTSIRTRRGALPEGMKLLTVHAGSVREGDLISYVPDLSVPGSHWVVITAVERYRSRGHNYVDMLSGSDRLVSVTQNQIIRIARWAASHMVMERNGEGQEGQEGLQERQHRDG